MNVTVYKGPETPNQLWPVAPSFDFYYHVAAEQRYVMQDIVAFGGGWYWQKSTNVLFQSDHEYQDATYMGSGNRPANPLRYRRKSDRLSGMDKLALAFCSMKIN